MMFDHLCYEADDHDGSQVAGITMPPKNPLRLLNNLFYFV